ncbi:hypothetical protein Tco_1142711 [Tanacetum coccineum]
MANLSEDIQCVGSDTRPPMLDKTDFASWQQRIRLYCRGKENGVNILKSIDEGPFQMGTTRVIVAEGTEGSPTRSLNDLESIRICHRMRRIGTMQTFGQQTSYFKLLEGSELTKEDRESQLYDDFEHFHQNKGETIHDYYVRFAKLINDMRNIKMTMSKIQLNSKFVNNMLPEWGRFVTAVKLNKGLKDSNFDQLYAYLKQHEAHANENKMILHQTQGNQPTVKKARFVSNDQSTERGQGNNAWCAVAAGMGATEQVGNSNSSSARQLSCCNCYDVETTGSRTLGLNVDNVFQADDCDAYDSDIDEAPMTQTMFMENLSSVDPVYDKAGPSYDSDILSEEQVELYEKTCQEENLKKELHSVKLQIASTIKHNKLMVDEVTSLKKDFNQKENKYLEEFLDLKALKDKSRINYSTKVSQFKTVHMMCKPKVLHMMEVNKVAIGYKNPLCLHRTRQVQPTLYSGHVIVTSNHAPAIVRDGEETLELTEISRKKMHDKMKANECVDNKVNITPPNYSKENFLATFTPQKQLTLEQIFWSQDIVKMKAEALKEQNTRPIKALTVYPPNTPATLVPRVLPTKSQVKINIFTLRQLFSEFEKTCKKRITPTGITEGERGFEQTKTCYLTEVIPFFKTLQEHFEGIQKALTKEVKEMSDAFDELEAELDQSIVDRKHDEIERKNLLLNMII